MPGEDYLFYRKLAEQTIEELTNKTGIWMQFLETSARMYKYPFPDQLMIFAQKPDAVACAQIETWNDTFKRWVPHQSKGIVLIDDSSTAPKLKYVFDYTETEAQRINTRPVRIWELLPEHHEPVLDLLAESYEGVTDTLNDTFHNIAKELADEYYDDNEHDLKYKAEESFLGNTPVYDFTGTPIDESDDINLRAAFVNALSSSIEYSLMSRCGIDTSENIDNSDFNSIYQFSASDMIYALGTAVSELSEQVLRDIETVIKKYERLHAAERSEQNYGRNHNLQNAGRLSDSQHHSVRTAISRDGDDGKIREDAQSISERTQDDQLQPVITDRETLSASPGSGGSSNSENGTNDENNDDEEQSTRQSLRSNGMDSRNERTEGTSRGNNPAPADIQLGERSTFSQIGKTSIKEILSTSPITLDEVDSILRDGGNENRSNLRIATHFAKALNNNEVFLKREYLYGIYYRKPSETGKGFIFGEKKVSVWYTQDGILLSIGNTAKRSRSNILIPWEHAAARIDELMNTGKYVSSDVFDEALDNELFELANNLCDFYRRSDIDYPDEWRAEHGGYPEDTDIIKGVLGDINARKGVLERLEHDYIELQDDSEKRHWINSEQLLFNMRNAVIPAKIIIESNFKDSQNFTRFITDDEVDSFIVRGGLYNEAKYRTLSYFLQNNNIKDRTDFIKKQYGHGGGTWSDGNGWYEASPGGGVKLTRGRGLLYPEAEIKLSWSIVTKLIEQYIKENRYLSNEELANLRDYELIHLTRSIIKFYEDLPEEYECPLSSDFNYQYPNEEDLEEMHNILDTSEHVENLLSEMGYIFKDTPENDRYYSRRKEAFTLLKAFQDGTYTLFPGIEELQKTNGTHRLNEQVIHIGNTIIIEPKQAGEQLSLFGMEEPLLDVVEQRDRIDRAFLFEDEQEKYEAGVDKTPVLFEPDALDTLLLGVSEESKKRIAEQYEKNLRSRESVNLINEIYGEINGVSLQQVIKRISELIESNSFAEPNMRSLDRDDDNSLEPQAVDTFSPEYAVNDHLYYDGRLHEIVQIDEFVKIHNLDTPRAYPIFDFISIPLERFNKMIIDGQINVEKISLPPDDGIRYYEWNYKVGDTVYLDDKPHEITSISELTGYVQTRPAVDTWTGYRSHSKSQFEFLLSMDKANEQYISKLEELSNISTEEQQSHHDLETYPEEYSNDFVEITDPDTIAIVDEIFGEKKPVPAANLLLLKRDRSAEEIIAYYLLHHPELTEEPAVLSHETLALIDEPASEYIICADACYLSQEEMDRWNITFRKMPIEFTLLPEEVQHNLQKINPNIVPSVEERIRDILSVHGYIVSDELIDDGISEFISEGLNGNIEDIAEFIINEMLTEIEEPELSVRLSEFILANYQYNYDDYTDGENGFETIEYSPIIIKDLLQNDPLMLIGILTEIKENDELSAIASILINEVQKDHQQIQIHEPKPISQIKQKHNYQITDDNLGEGSAKVKYRNNIVALQILNRIESENHPATTEEQELLSRYVGWGGLPQVFDQQNSQWTNEYIELNNLLSPDEWESARASTLNAHYTPPIVIKAMYNMIDRLGFKTGNILEPSCGVGNFLGLLPHSMNDSKIYAVELDSVTARIAKQLYPNINIQHSGFEKTEYPDAFFDIAIGNVPFGNYKVADSRYDKYGFNLHNYFFAKTIDKVRPGGVIAFITSKYTMDEKNPKVRRYIAERAELLGAVRLPNNTFLKNAGTENSMDILFLQKRDRPLDIEPEWVHLSFTDNGIPVNKYFIDNPEMLLGKMAPDERMNSRYGRDDATTCLPLEGADLAEQLDTALSLVEGQYTVDELDDLDGIDNHAIPADTHVKNFSYALVKPIKSEVNVNLFNDNLNDARVYFRENSLMYPVDLPATTIERIKGMIALRNCVQKLISLQLDEYGDKEIKEQQDELNGLYDRFTAEFGLINSSANNKAFNADNSYYLLCSLEILNEDGELERKADMFSKRTIKQKNVISRVDTPSEALAVSIAEKACVDLDFMSSISELNKKKLITDLQGVIFLNIGEAGSQKEMYVTADEYLSGNVRKKLEQAKAAAEVDPSLDTNVKALEAVQPKELEATDIAVRLGATWIDPEYINEFMRDLLNLSWRMQNIYQVNYHPMTDSWQVAGKGKALYSDINANVTYGTERANAYEIIDDTLNLRDVRVYDYKQDNEGKTVRVLNKKETTLAQQKQELIKQKFQDWIWKDPERRHKLVKLYNERFNSHRPREYDGSHIQFIGTNPDIAFHPHQINAVARQIYGGNTLLAHVVGAGKTFEMVGAAMESKRLGLCHKSLFSVPNHLTEQWGAEFLRLYPNANILVARKKDFEMRNRKKFCAKIATGDYDAVIIGHTQLEKIPMSRERQERLLNEQIWEIQSGIEELKALNGERWSIKQLERTKKSIEARLTKLIESKKRDDVVTFEQLGVDRLFVDEAHNFKNLFMFTKMRNVAGLSTSEAQKSSDLFMKCRYMDEITGGKGIIFATGTPISNSMTEMYTMQRYLQYDKLLEKGLTHFDCWASIFGETQTSIELAPEGTGYRARTRFAKFHNLPELMCMFKEVADIQTADMINLPVPDAKYDTIVVEPSELQKEMVQELSERAVAVQNRQVDPSTDNMLKITTDGRKIGLDQRLMNPLLPDFEGSKVNACTENVYAIWNDSRANRLTQLVFCDFSTPNKDGRFNVYDDIRMKLIDRGIPESEIAFIHDADTETKKKELFAKVRQGKVRVLFGSTFKMGSGTNVQDRLIAIHDADCPWRPADLEQRAGRIVRQGNRNPEVMIYRYATNGTFDSYLWQTVQKKQEFISQIMTSKSPVRSCEDVDETALSYAEIKALCAGNPLIAEKMNLDIEVTKLRMLKSEHQSLQHRLEDDLMTNFPKKITAVTERINGIERDAKAYSEVKAKYTDMRIVSGNASVTSKFAGMTINNITYNEKEPAAKALLEACKGLTGRDEKWIQGEYMGFELSLQYAGGFDKQVNLLLRRILTYKVDLGTDAFGNITRINNALDSLPDRLDGAKDELANIQKQQDAAKLEIEKPFALSDELAEKEARLAMLNAELNIDGEGYFDIVSNSDERDSDDEKREDIIEENYDDYESEDEEVYDYNYSRTPQLVPAKSVKPSIIDGLRDYESTKQQNMQNKDKPIGRGI